MHMELLAARVHVVVELFSCAACSPRWQVYWTREVTEAIHSGGTKGLSAYAHK